MLSAFRSTCLPLLAAAAILSVAASLSFAQVTGVNTAPSYTVQSIVQAATQTAEALAPNAIATIYGTNLAFNTESATSGSLVQGSLPESIGGVSVVVEGFIANMFYISPTQVNFLIPYQLVAGTVTVVVTRQGVAGPTVSIQLNATAPGMFLYNGFVLAEHLNGTLVNAAAPASQGEIIVLYVVGLGRVTPDTTAGHIASNAATITAFSQLQILLAGTPCPAGSVLYAGLAPGFAGLYQINFIVPPLTPANPEIRIAVGPQISPPAVTLATN
jgi:uncharacterized protein (TIGR03437 family)